DDRNQGDFDPSARGRYAGQHPVDFTAMGEGEKHLVDDLVPANRTTDRDALRVIRILPDEMVFIEALQLVVSDAANHGRDVVDVRRVDHCCHGSIDVPCLEFVPAMGFPESDEVMVGHDSLPVHGPILPLAWTHPKGCATSRISCFTMS